MRFLFLIMALTPLTACVELDPEVQFSKQEAAFIHNVGTTRIEGHVFTQHFPKPIFGVGEIVRLIPVTPYFTDRIHEIFGDEKFVPYLLAPKIETDPDEKAYIRTTKTEFDGRFAFSNVAAGHYYVQSQVTWRKDTSIITDGKLVYDDVTVTGQESLPIKVILSGN